MKKKNLFTKLFKTFGDKQGFPGTNTFFFNREELNYSSSFMTCTDCSAFLYVKFFSHINPNDI